MIKVRLYKYISTKKMTLFYIQERKKDYLLDHIFFNTYHNISLEKDQKFGKFWKNNIKVGPTSNDHSRPLKRHRIVFFKKFSKKNKNSVKHF
jgi:hypothetical protein